MKAAPTDQLRLLELQSIDTRLDQLAHRRRTLPEHAELEKLERRLAEVRDGIVVAETQRSDLERQRVKAEGDVAQVRQRATRDQQRLDAGQVSSPRELENLQSEIASLARRQADLEEIELEVMERVEEVEERLGELTVRRGDLTRERDELAARREQLLAGIDEEAATNRAMREVLAGQIDPALLGLYQKVREQQGGIGAAPVHQRRCQGCRLELNATELAHFRDAPDDDVLRCEECRRILVRTPESGL